MGDISDPGLHPRPGTRLVREWRGRTHTVVVTDNSFEYAGKAYSSLSKIAQVITGAHWSGPRFFGLNRRSTPGVVQSESIMRVTPLASETTAMVDQTSNDAGRRQMRLRCDLYP